MVSPKQLDFSSPGVGDSVSDDTLSRRKSQRNSASKRAVPDAEEVEDETKKLNKTKKKKKKKKSMSNRIWDEEDELIVLKGLVDYRAKTGFQPKIDWDSFYGFVGDSIIAKFSKEQCLSKIRKLKRRFLIQSEKINQGHDPHFTRSGDSEAFGFSMMIWGQNEAEFSHGDLDDEMLKSPEDPKNDYREKDNGTAQNGEEVLEEQVDVANVEPFNDNGNSHHGNGTEKGTARNGEEMLKEQGDAANVELLNDNGESHHDNETENGTARNGKEMLKEQVDVANVELFNENGAEKRTAGKESHDDDELCAVKDAFEIMMSQGLSDYQKKLQLEKLMNLGASKRRELSDEWKALCLEEGRLNVKKLRFSAKLAEAANDS